MQATRSAATTAWWGSDLGAHGLAALRGYAEEPLTMLLCGTCQSANGLVPGSQLPAALLGCRHRRGPLCCWAGMAWGLRQGVWGLVLGLAVGCHQQRLCTKCLRSNRAAAKVLGVAAHGDSKFSIGRHSFKAQQVHLECGWAGCVEPDADLAGRNTSIILSALMRGLGSMLA